MFDYETPLYTEFKEFKFLLKVDPKLFTHNIERTNTNEDYENELNDELEEPWSEDGVPYKMRDHIYYWEKVNDNECSLFSNWRDHIQGPYANFFTTYDPHLDINSIFSIHNNASNMSNVQEKERCERCNLFNNTAHNASICKIRRFEMIKYSFGQDEEYVAIKECKYDDLTKTNDDVMRAIHSLIFVALG
ncbi:hypothetical protein Tco_0778084 [Tanacetum coccineum]